MRISKKHEFNTRYIVKSKYEQSRWTIAILFCLLLFVFVFFPIFGLNWRYEIGGALSILIDGLGSFCLGIGGLLLLIGLVEIFTRSGRWTKKVVIGVMLLWIGCWCTGTVVNFFGILIGNTTSGGQGWQ